jgi:hypothetical protein
MKRPEFTPGPWKAEPGNVGSDHPLFVTAQGKDGFRPWSDADALLIATAPEGYRLAELVVKYFGKEELDPLLDCDIRLRDAARAILLRVRPGAGRLW